MKEREGEMEKQGCGGFCCGGNAVMRGRKGVCVW